MNNKINTLNSQIDELTEKKEQEKEKYLKNEMKKKGIKVISQNDWLTYIDSEGVQKKFWLEVFVNMNVYLEYMINGVGETL